MNRINSCFQDPSKKPLNVTVQYLPEANFRRWKPTTLRRPFLLVVILITGALFALIQVLLLQSERNQGLFFASNRGDFRPYEVFLHRYLPTIIAVTYGILWHWIDLDTRRIEPYRQLSKPGGADGRDSLLLRYPTDLLAFVPLRALKRRHWSVVISSFSLVLVGIGLTPLQAAMFATENITKSFAEPMLLFSERLSIADQATQVTANYTYSVSNIVWLDERLPRFMTREAAFMPFQPVLSRLPQDNETWTAETISFSVDIKCDEAVFNRTGGTWLSPQRCKVPDPFGPDGTDIIGSTDVSQTSKVKEFTPFFAGNQNYDGMADYYLNDYCPKEASNVFMVALAKNRHSSAHPPGPVTRLFCNTTYYQQNVTATVRQRDGQIMNATDYGPKLPLPSGMFNFSLFEWQVNSAMQQNTVRGAVPSNKWPDQSAHLAQLPVSFPEYYITMLHMVGLAIGAYPRPFEDYMDPQVLAASYQAAHRLLFARAIIDIFPDDSETREEESGIRSYQTQAVQIVPRFAYVVMGILGVVLVMTSALLILCWGSFLKLSADPDSLSALMTLVRGQRGILSQYRPHDRSSWKQLKNGTCDSTYALDMSPTDNECTLELKATHTRVDESDLQHFDHERDALEYPAEFSRIVGTIFVLSLMAALGIISYFYHTGRVDGLALPSHNRFVRQMLENYLPTIVATLIEPLWVVLNRLLCLLQPYEELTALNASPSRSVDINYASVPPQFTVFKAIRARHFILSAVCIMTLLTNVLAVAFGGMFSEGVLPVTRPINSTRLFEPRFRPSFENVSQVSPDLFYIAMANFTSETSLPAWIDEDAFYVPVTLPAGLNSSADVEIDNLPSIRAQVECTLLGRGLKHAWTFSEESFTDQIVPKANLSLMSGDGQICSPESMNVGTAHYPFPCSEQNMALEVITPLASNLSAQAPKDPCQQLIAGMWARKPAHQICQNNTIDLTDDDASAILCKPTVITQLANITVTSNGLVQSVRGRSEHVTVSNETDEVVREAARYLFQPISAVNTGSFDHGGIWHNDSFPSDWYSYAMNMMAPNSSFLDAARPIPDYQETAPLFSKAYQKIFAIWLGMNHETLLLPAADNLVVAATARQPETRIKVSGAMTILSSSILALYITVAIVVYLRRPGKYLPRMPLTMASDVAMFAASHAIKEMECASSLSNSERNAYSSMGSTKFGYGNFVGTDGKFHVGIEKSPLVTPL